MTSQQADEAPSPTGGGASLCSKCGINERGPRGSWCRECRREAQRNYNARVRPRPQKKIGTCEVCGESMEWLSGRGPDRVYCSTACKRRVDHMLKQQRLLSADPRGMARVELRARREAFADRGMKECSACLQVKLFEEYYRRGGSLQPRCKTCMAIDPTATRRLWLHHLRRKYGLDFEQWSALLVGQQGRCGVCDMPMDEPCVDHDHETNQVRGLLCNSCNIRLHKGPIAWYAAAAAYLQRHAIQGEL